MIYTLIVVLSAKAEADGVPNLVHDLADVRFHLRRGGVSEHCLITAGIVKPNTAGRYRVGIRYYAADGHSVTLVMITHQRYVIRRTGTPADLRHRSFVYRRSKYWNSVNHSHTILLW
jgi:hypothetical protein